MEPCIFVFFGITGDLAQRKLLPALYHLFKDGQIHEESIILGISRRDVTAEELLGRVELCVNEVDNICDPTAMHKIQRALRMHRMSLTDEEEYDELLTLLNAIEDEKGMCMSRLYYLSIPPQMFEPIVSNLGQHGLNMTCPHGTAGSRLLVEKPFGYDLDSAKKLIAATGEWFDEDQLFRIDHYIAKEAVQNILAFRRSNPSVEELWNKGSISSIEVTAYEELSIEGRAVFYDEVGALRDFVQSHLLQLLAVTTMELPANLDSNSVHEAKENLFASILPVPVDQVSHKAQRGQYQGYQEDAENPESFTETYACLTLQIDSKRWQGIPMIVRTGKAMDHKTTEIKVKFAGLDGSSPKELVFDILRSTICLDTDPETVSISEVLQTAVTKFEFDHQPDSAKPVTDGYERVLLDAIRGDHMVFTTSSEILYSWVIIENVLSEWSQSGNNLIVYPKSSFLVHL